MIKVVIADYVGGYWLSEKAYECLGLDWQMEVIAVMERAYPGISKSVEMKGFAFYEDRSNPKLIECVEKLGMGAGNYLVVVNVDDEKPWDIVRDDEGWESIRYLDENV